MNPLKQERLSKLEKIKALGIHPYPERFEHTHYSSEALTDGETTELRSVEEVSESNKANITMRGRMMSFRSFGKLTFAHLQDDKGRIQVCFMKGMLSEKEEDLVKLLDIGDFIGVTGELFKTKHGEITLMVSRLTFLGKALLPLPEKFHGLKDQEAKYRQRYLDVAMDPEAKKRFEFRSLFVRKMREFYWKEGFIEMEFPYLASSASGALAKPFVTHHNALDRDFYLRIAIETPQKEIIVGGFEKTFEIGKVFRNEGMDPSHLQEFTMCEHYAAYWNYEDNIKFTEKMFRFLLMETLGTLKVSIKDREGQTHEIDFGQPWKKVDMAELIEGDCGINIRHFDSAADLLKTINDKGIQLDEDGSKLGLGNLIDQLYKKVSRPKITHPTFLIKHPVELSPLARRNDENPKVVDRFQLVVSGWEIVNAYSEIVDPIDQAARFEEQAKSKAAGDEDAHGKDDDFILAMEHGMPPISGWGMGVDRMVTLLTEQDNLRDVVLFPLMKPLPNKSATVETCHGTSLQHQHPENPSSNPKTMSNHTTISAGISYDRAVEILDKYIKEKPLRNHVRESEVVMRALARRLGEDEETWGIAGLLHDIDWEAVNYDASQHCVKAIEILKSEGVSDELIEVIISHTYGIPECAYPDRQREGKFQHALACGETITGLVYSYGLMRPEKLNGASVKSLKKKFKDKSFAANVNREIIQECEHLGLELGEFFQLAIDAIAEISEEIYS